MRAGSAMKPMMCSCISVSAELLPIPPLCPVLRCRAAIPSLSICVCTDRQKYTIPLIHNIDWWRSRKICITLLLQVRAPGAYSITPRWARQHATRSIRQVCWTRCPGAPLSESTVVTAQLNARLRRHVSLDQFPMRVAIGNRWQISGRYNQKLGRDLPAHETVPTQRCRCNRKCTSKHHRSRHRIDH